MFILSFISSILSYLLACLPGLSYAREKIEHSAPVIRFTLNDSVKIFQYLEFAQIWYVLLFELIKLIIFIAILNSSNLILLFGFTAGLYFPFWGLKKHRDFSLYLFCFLLITQFLLCFLYVLFWVWGIKNAKGMIPFANLFFLLLVTLIFWVSGEDLVLVFQGLLLFLFASLFVYLKKYNSGMLRNS